MNDIVSYETTHGTVELSPETIKKYLVNGGGNITDQEVMMFLQLCRYQKLNPFIREAYLIKFGSEPATIVVGKDVFTKRASLIPDFTGYEAGIIIKAKNQIEYRKGSLLLADEELIGGWARVYRKSWQVPLESAVSLKEYMRYRKDGQPQQNWRNMPATMIRKVALVQALREAFPSDFQGLYSEEEMPVPELPKNIVTPTAEVIDIAPEKPEQTEHEKIEAAEETIKPEKSTIEKQSELEVIAVDGLTDGYAPAVVLDTDEEIVIQTDHAVEAGHIYKITGFKDGNIIRVTSIQDVASDTATDTETIEAELTSTPKKMDLEVDGEILKDIPVAKAALSGKPEIVLVGSSLAGLTKGKKVKTAVIKKTVVKNKETWLVS